MTKTEVIWLSLIGIGGALYSWFSGLSWMIHAFFLGLAALSLILVWVLRKRERWPWRICIIGTGISVSLIAWLSYMQSLVFALYVIVPLGYTGQVAIDFSCFIAPQLSPNATALIMDIDESGHIKVHNAAPERPALVVYFSDEDTVYGPLEHEVDHTLPQYVDGECGQRLVFEVFPVPLDSVAMGLKGG